MKAVLVIDMPSDCNHCQFADFSNGQWECNQHKGGRIADAMKVNSVPSWCPLRSIPSKACERLVEGLDAMEKMKSVEVRVVRKTE